MWIFNCAVGSPRLCLRLTVFGPSLAYRCAKFFFWGGAEMDRTFYHFKFSLTNNHSGSQVPQLLNSIARYLTK